MIYSELRKHRKLANKRNPMFEKNRFAKLITSISISIWLLYLVLIGLFLPTLFQKAQPNSEAFHLFNQGMLYLLTLDFYFRFLFLKVPVQEIKPYILLPVKKKQLIQYFLLRSGLSSYNLFWFALLIPFAFTAIFKYYGLTGVLGFLIGYWILFLINNYWYLLCRTIINERFVFILLSLIHI